MTQQVPDARGIVVVGAGVAAANVVDALRDGGYRGTLTMIGNEARLPYERPPLSKAVLAGIKDIDSTYVHDGAWYTGHDITLHLNDEARRIDRDRREVTLTSGTVVPYSDLVLATGASARTLELPGADLEGVHVLRTIADSLALRDAFTHGKNLVIIGAGWIGLEVAAVARGAGLDVTVLEYAKVPLQASLGAQLGEHFATLHRGNGVNLYTGVGVDAIEATEGRVSGVRSEETIYPADLVLVSVGATPNTVLARDAGLDVDNGILVNDQLRSSDPRILAAGDVANAYNPTLGTRLRVEHWDNAIRQGKLAANILLGRQEHYDWQPYFYTDQFQLGMEYVGRGNAEDDVIIRGDQASGAFIAFWLREGIITAAMNVNTWDVSDDLRALLGQRIEPTELANTAVALSAH